MRVIFFKTLLINSLLFSLVWANAQQKEIAKELAQLKKLKELIEKKITQNKEILKKIEKERADLEKFKKELQNEIKKINNERYKKLAKDFENMDPEYAGEKLSKMDDPVIAAYILYNMNSRKAGEALNYVDPAALSTITKILIKLQRNEQNSTR